ncbi:hypothetical protein V8C26DRAFT_397446 [Trichoderma gracile]
MGYLDCFRKRRHERPTPPSLSNTAQPSQPLPEVTLEQDGDPTQPMLPSYQQATETVDGTAYHSTSHVESPCVCGPHQGCCRKHNSLRSPNRAFVEQSPTSLRFQCFTSSQSDVSKPETGDNETEESTLGPQSSLTITPVHAVMAYHLSLDHLNCIRGRLKPGTARAFIPELSYEDDCSSEIGTRYCLSNEIYFHRGTFLQKQEVDCYLHRQDDNQPEHFTTCPHQSLTVSVPQFTIRNNMQEVSARLINNPPRCASHGSETWSNTQGQYAQIVSCKICHSDAECVLKLHCRSLRIRYTCYRDLGPGMDSSHHKWLALLTGKGDPRHQEHELEVYTRVWNTANGLRRPGLYKVRHQLPSGVFEIGT